MSSAASGAKKNILILGSTGPMGRLTTKEALSDHFKVTIFVRSPGKVPQEIKDNEKVTASNPKPEQLTSRLISTDDRRTTYRDF
jgi:putative NADH-flavin reductase